MGYFFRFIEHGHIAVDASVMHRRTMCSVLPLKCLCILVNGEKCLQGSPPRKTASDMNMCVADWARGKTQWHRLSQQVLQPIHPASDTCTLTGPWWRGKRSGDRHM